MNLLIVFFFSIIFPQQSKATTTLSKALCEKSVKRNFLSFLDPNTLGRLTYTSRDFKESVDAMDYFIENKKFLTTIFRIKIVLSNIEFLGQNGRENKEIIKNQVIKLFSLLHDLYPHIQLVSQKKFEIKDSSLYSPIVIREPIYNPEFCGNKARDQALAKTITAKRTDIQQLFIRVFKFYKFDSVLDKDLFTSLDNRFSNFRDYHDLVCKSALADYEVIKAGMIHESGLSEEDLIFTVCHQDLLDVNWVSNPNTSAEVLKEVLDRTMDKYIVSSDSVINFIQLIFSSPVNSKETIKDYFEGLLETTERAEGEGEGEFQEKKFAFASAIALNPDAISKFGSRLFSWLIQNEEMLLLAEHGLYFTSNTSFEPEHYFPLSALMFNSNLPETTSQEVLDYLLRNLKQLAGTTPIPIGHYSRWAPFQNKPIENDLLFSSFSKKNLFSKFLLRFARTAHGSEVILKKLEIVLAERHFSFKYKCVLIQCLLEGFDWDYYFKNYSINHDVKRPGHFPEKAASAIIDWLSQLPQLQMPTNILKEMVFRGGLNSESIHKTIDLITEHSDAKFKIEILIKLIEKSSLYSDHYQRISHILESYPDETNRLIQEAISLKNSEKEFRKLHH